MQTRLTITPSRRTCRRRPAHASGQLELSQRDQHLATTHARPRQRGDRIGARRDRLEHSQLPRVERRPVRRSRHPGCRRRTPRRARPGHPGSRRTLNQQRVRSLDSRIVHRAGHRPQSAAQRSAKRAVDKAPEPSRAWTMTVSRDSAGDDPVAGDEGPFAHRRPWPELAHDRAASTDLAVQLSVRLGIGLGRTAWQAPRPCGPPPPAHHGARPASTPMAMPLTTHQATRTDSPSQLSGPPRCPYSVARRAPTTATGSAAGELEEALHPAGDVQHRRRRPAGVATAVDTRRHTCTQAPAQQPRPGPARPRHGSAPNCLYSRASSSSTRSTQSPISASSLRLRISSICLRWKLR